MISPGLVELAWQAAWGTVISHQKTHRASQGLGSVLSKNTCVYVCLCSFLRVCWCALWPRVSLEEDVSGLTGHLLCCFQRGLS